MKIYGLQKTTLLDYPEHVAATVFTGGCNFRCPFCQNAELVFVGGCGAQDAAGAEGGCAQNVQVIRAILPPEPIPEEEVFAHLRKRQGILDGLCITGGEPALQPDLEDFIRRIKALGYAVKLDTNGYRPEVLANLLELELPDYIAMDIKAAKENYARAAGLGQIDIGKIEESVRLLQNSGIPYEFRTTAVKGLHTVEEFAQIGEWLQGSRAYFIQSYEEQGEILGKINGTAETFGSFSAEELRHMARLAGRYISRVELRGVDEQEVSV